MRRCLLEEFPTTLQSKDLHASSGKIMLVRPFELRVHLIIVCMRAFGKTITARSAEAPLIHWLSERSLRAHCIPTTLPPQQPPFAHNMQAVKLESPRSVVFCLLSDDAHNNPAAGVHFAATRKSVFPAHARRFSAPDVRLPRLASFPSTQFRLFQPEFAAGTMRGLAWAHNHHGPDFETILAKKL